MNCLKKLEFQVLFAAEALIQNMADLASYDPPYCSDSDVAASFEDFELEHSLTFGFLHDEMVTCQDPSFHLLIDLMAFSFYAGVHSHVHHTFLDAYLDLLAFFGDPSSYFHGDVLDLLVPYQEA